MTDITQAIKAAAFQPSEPQQDTGNNTPSEPDTGQEDNLPQDDQVSDNEPDINERVQQLERELANVNSRYEASSREGRRLNRELSKAEERLEELQAGNTASDTGVSEDLAEKLAEVAHDPAAQLEIIQEVARAEAEKMIHQRTEPARQLEDAVSRYSEDHSDFQADEAGVTKFLESHPAKQKVFASIAATDIYAAIEYAHDAYKMETGGTKPNREKADTSREKAHASVRTGRGNSPAAQSRDRSSEDNERLSQLREEGIESGNPRAYIEQSLLSAAKGHHKLALPGKRPPGSIEE